MAEKAGVHYWFSKGQQRSAMLPLVEFGERSRSRIQRSYYRQLQIVQGGQRFDFTESTESDKPSGSWDDYQLVLVGDGTQTFGERDYTKEEREAAK